MKHYLTTILIILLSLTAIAQSDTVIYDRTYKPHIYTALVHPVKFEPVLPVIELGSDQKLMLSFDDLENDNKFYTYTFIHCNADWTPSQLIYTQYATGLPYDYINDWKFSLNVQKTYTNYRLTFPNDNINLTKSGNYIIKVYDNDDPNDIVLTKRFMVVERIVGATALVQRSSDPQYRNMKHEIDFTIDVSKMNVTDAYNQVKPVLMQNERWDNAIYGLKPLYNNSGKLTYDYYDQNTFNGGNEFRFFDARNVRLTNDRVYNITYEEDKQYHFFLSKDQNRIVNRYNVMDDINGRFFIRLFSGVDYYSEADYVWVHFALEAETPVDGDVYVFGLLSNWQIQPRFKLDYNATRKVYEGLVMVKQGYYNYEYVVAKNGVVDDTYFEGNHFETENQYNLLVYVRAFGDRADRLVAVERFNSIPGR